MNIKFQPNDTVFFFRPEIGIIGTKIKYVIVKTGVYGVFGYTKQLTEAQLHRTIEEARVDETEYSLYIKDCGNKYK